MAVKKNIDDYLHFSFEDFLRDDYFVATHLHPTPESELFWADFLRGHTPNEADFTKAAKCIEDLNKNLATDAAITQIWNRIQKSNNWNRLKTKIVYFAVSIAASAALFLFLRQHPFAPSTDTNACGLKIYAGAYPDINVAEVQLILSDGDTVNLPGRQSVITCGPKSVKVQSGGIKKIPNKESSGYNRLVVPKGKRTIIDLSDGTRIWVNSGTRLIFPPEFAADKREVYVDGEIFISVFPDAARPFSVLTSDFDMEVLGTEFGVHAYAGDELKRVVLKSGALKISDSGAADILLKPDEMYESAGGAGRVGKVDADAYTSWVDGIYICDEESPHDFFIWLSRYYGVEIAVDESVAGLRFNGKLELKEDLKDVLRIIEFIAPVSCIGENNRYTVIRKRH